MKLIFLIIILIITVACTNITEIYDGTNGSTKIEYDILFFHITILIYLKWFQYYYPYYQFHLI